MPKFLSQGKTLALKESIDMDPEHSKKKKPDQSSKSHYVWGENMAITPCSAKTVIRNFVLVLE